MAVRGITRATDTVALRPSPPRSRCFSTHRAEASVVPAASSGFGDRRGAGVAAHGFGRVGHHHLGQLGGGVEVQRPAGLRGQRQQRGFVGLERDAAHAGHLSALKAGHGQGFVDRSRQRSQGRAAVAADAQGHLHAAASVVASLPAGSGGRYTTSRSCSVCQSVSSTGRWVIHSTAR